MKKTYILPFLAAALLAGGCSKENPFGGGSDEEGKILKSALSVSIKADGLERQNIRTRAEADLNDFTVVFTQQGHSEPVRKYKYGEMPDVVSLPAGTYTCTATYGELRQAEWESPYFLGSSETFEVTPYEITSYIEPIECKLENIKVTIDFDSELRNAMSEETFVEVKVGSSSSLNFTKAEADSQKAGYFSHTAETTLVATFNGKINGVQTVETKSMQNIEKGNHYKITFRLHPESGGSSGGDITGDVTVDASVTVVDVTRNVPLGDEPLLDDSERPNEGSSEDPDPPTPPENPAPTIEGVAPLNLDNVNDLSTLTSCIINIHSSAEGGITGFTCDIESPKLTKDELVGMGLDSHLDLVNTPEASVEALGGLGFPVNVGGMKDVTVDISGFLDAMKVLGAAEHHFILTVTDANGTTTKTLKLKL